MSELVSAEQVVAAGAGPMTRIFVLEDQTLVREGLLALLKSEAALDVVGDSSRVEGAAAKILAAAPDVVVTDLGMDGCVFTMIRDLRKVAPHLKFIVVTAFDTEMNVASALQLGVDGFFRKTDSIDELIEAIMQVRAGHFVCSDALRDRINSAREVGVDSAKSRALSLREVEVLRLVARGYSAKEVAKSLQISVKTVDRHKSNMMQKLNMHNQVELTRYAIRGGLVDA